MKKNTQIIIDSPVLVLVGPTAIGKTSLSLEIAENYGCEIVSVDSMQVYRYMDIGTAKPSAEEQGGIVHHLIDIVDPDEQYDAALFVRHALHAITTISRRGGIPLLTGGTGLYLKALFHGLFDHEINIDKSIRKDLERQLLEQGNQYLFEHLLKVDPETARRIHPNDSQRLLRALEIYIASGIPWSKQLHQQPSPPVIFMKVLQIGLHCDRHLLHERIGKRTDQMLESGFVEEVKRLRKMGYVPGLSSMQSIGYRHINNYLDGVWNREETLRLLKRDTRRYAKRQMTWFGGDQSIQWFDRSASDEVLSIIDNWLDD